DPSRRSQLQEQAVPLIRRQLALMEDLAAVTPAYAAAMAEQRMMFNGFLAILGDEQAEEQISQWADGPDAAQAASAREARFLLAWWRAANDPEAQLELLEVMDERLGEGRSNQAM